MSNRTNIDLKKYSQPTDLINADHPLIRKQVDALQHGAGCDEERARRLFYFIRDEIKYDFKPKLEASGYRASSILEEGGGFCTMKAILFCAMARACDFPAGIHFYHIIDHTLPKPMVRMLRTNTLYYHGIVSLWLGDSWFQYDATLDRSIIDRKRLISVEFVYRSNCLMSSKTRTGRPHIEYTDDIGLVHDISFDQIRGWLREAYPHIYRG